MTTESQISCKKRLIDKEWNAWVGPYHLMVFSPPLSHNPKSKKWDWCICGARNGGIVKTLEQAKAAAKAAVITKLKVALTEAEEL